jgi:hypothetical protein
MSGGILETLIDQRIADIIGERLAGLDIAALNARADTLDQQVQQLTDTVLSVIEPIDDRFSGMDQRLDGFDSRLAGYEQEAHRLAEAYREIDARSHQAGVVTDKISRHLDQIEQTLQIIGRRSNVIVGTPDPEPEPPKLPPQKPRSITSAITALRDSRKAPAKVSPTASGACGCVKPSKTLGSRRGKMVCLTCNGTVKRTA